jgi:hypothetical protein
MIPTYRNPGFFLVTNNGHYSRGLSLSNCIKRAEVKKGTKFYVAVFVFENNTTNEVKEKILQCFCVNIFGKIEYCLDVSEEDQKMISDNVRGYVIFNEEIK